MAKQIQIVPKNLVFPTARVLDKEDSELYQEVFRKTAEKYGKNSLAYRTITNGIDAKDVTGSQFFWNTNLGSYLPKGQRVISLEDMEAINDLDESFFTGYYSDAPEVCLRSDSTSYEKNKYIIENLVKQVRGEKKEFSPENPLRISGLELIKDENSKNEWGLFLQIGQNTRMINDSRFGYSNNKREIPFGEKQKTVFTQNNGLSGFCLGRDSGVYSGSGYLANSDDSGRVVVIDAEGVAS